MIMASPCCHGFFDIEKNWCNRFPCLFEASFSCSKRVAMVTVKRDKPPQKKSVNFLEECLNQIRFLKNCSPTPPLSQHLHLLLALGKSLLRGGVGGHFPRNLNCFIVNNRLSAATQIGATLE